MFGLRAALEHEDSEIVEAIDDHGRVYDLNEVPIRTEVK